MIAMPTLTPAQEREAASRSTMRQQIEKERIEARDRVHTPAEYVFKITPYVATPEAIAQREADKQREIIVGLKAKMNLPLRHQRLEKFEGEEWKARLEQVTQKIGKGFILALIGQRGTGKTQMAVECIERAISQAKRAEYCLAMDFFLKIKATFSRDAAEDEGDVLNRYCVPKLLVIDEIQERAESQWEDRLMTHLINRRYNDMKDTLLISNLCKEEFVASIGSSIASRLNETGGICQCNWKSFRT